MNDQTAVIKLYERLNQNLMLQNSLLSEYMYRILERSIQFDAFLLPWLLKRQDMPEIKADFIKLIRKEFYLSLTQSADIYDIYIKRKLTMPSLIPDPHE